MVGVLCRTIDADRRDRTDLQAARIQEKQPRFMDQVLTLPTPLDVRSRAEVMDSMQRVAHAAAFLRQLHGDHGIYEIRVPGVTGRGKPYTASGCFGDPETGAEAALQFDGFARAPGIYTTINELHPGCYARSPGRIAPYAGTTTSDKDVVRRFWLPLDFDPERPAGIASSEDELKAACKCASAVYRWLQDEHGIDSLRATSGNGAYLLLRIDLLNDAGSLGLIKGVLCGIATKLIELCPDTAVKLDQTMYNAARIIRVMGTTNRKGTHTADRPHRVAALYESEPKNLSPIPSEKLRDLAALAKIKQPTHTKKGNKKQNNGDRRLLVDTWLKDNGISFREKPGEAQGRMRWILDECPFDSSHKNDDAAVMQEANGKLSFKCFHDSCSGYGWQELKTKIGKPKPEHYDPPLPVRSGKKQKKTKADEATAGTLDAEKPDPCTDLANAERLAKRHGNDLRHCHPWKKWLIWDGSRWSTDEVGAITAKAKDTVLAILKDFKELEELDLADLSPEEAEKALESVLESADDLVEHAKNSQDARAINRMIALARSEPGIPVLPASLDCDSLALNVANGTIDLRTGILRAHRREDLLTKLAPVRYDPDAECETWERFLEHIFQANSELILFVRRLLGYCLTGDIREHVLPIFWGVGANGKSTLLNTFFELLGQDYAMKAPSDLLMEKRSETHPTERASLFGKRFVAAVESGEGARLAETLVKELTGGDPVTARRMREDFWTFNPTHKLVLCTNHKPNVQGTDHAIWRRIRLVPFEVVIPDAQQDKTLPGKLRAELPGILAWCLRGCLEWQQEGLGNPDVVRCATATYRDSQDIIAAFFAECCVTGSSDYRCRAGELYARYKEWSETSGERVMPQRRFGQQLTNRRIERYTNNGTWYIGVALKQTD
jgi:P4 family phage/plasmid primase-like protien